MTRDENIKKAIKIHKSFSGKISFYSNLAFDFKSKHSAVHMRKYNMYNELAKRAYELVLKLLNTSNNMKHLLKILPEYFEEVVKGTKTFEVRKNDRGFKVGDILELAEYCHSIQSFTGRFCEKKVSYILEGGSFGIEKGFVVMGLQNGFS
ncbi:MAG: hypothetical protein ACI9DK_003281 [Vicingaceae bacterium]|jgi:hypothetical protein